MPICQPLSTNIEEKKLNCQDINTFYQVSIDRIQRLSVIDKPLNPGSFQGHGQAKFRLEQRRLPGDYGARQPTPSSLTRY
jgi:hypothetical protein